MNRETYIIAEIHNETGFVTREPWPICLKEKRLYDGDSIYDLMLLGGSDGLFVRQVIDGEPDQDRTKEALEWCANEYLETRHDWVDYEGEMVLYDGCPDGVLGTDAYEAHQRAEAQGHPVPLGTYHDPNKEHRTW